MADTYDDDYLDDDNVIYLFLLPDITRKLEGDKRIWRRLRRYRHS